MIGTPDQMIEFADRLKVAAEKARDDGELQHVYGTLVLSVREEGR